MDTTKTELAENIERTVERVALRKVRKLVDEVQREETNQRTIQKHIAVATLTCLVAFFVLQVWQKTQQQKADRAREAIYACEDRASREEMPRLRGELMREQPNLDPREFRARLFERQAILWAKVRRQCMTAAAS